MAYFQRVWAQIDPDGIVQNRIVCDDYEMANYLAKCTYGENAQSVQINNWAVTEGDVYKDNVFYAPDGQTKREYIPDVEEEVQTIKTASNNITGPFKLMAQSFPEEIALTAKSFYSEWSSYPDGYQFTKDKYVLAGDVLYKVITDHKKQSDWNPSAAPSLFAKVLTDPSGSILEWMQPDSTNPYMMNDKVKHNGHIWMSTIDNNVWEPGVIGTEALWIDVCEDHD